MYRTSLGDCFCQYINKIHSTKPGFHEVASMKLLDSSQSCLIHFQVLKRLLRWQHSCCIQFTLKTSDFKNCRTYCQSRKQVNSFYKCLMLLKVAVKRYDLAKNINTKKIKMRKKIVFECTQFYISSAFLFYVAFMSSVLRSLVLYMFKVS